jgi:condensin complex subunit 2
MAASEGLAGYDHDDTRPRVGSRSSIGGRRSLSGAKPVTSALRRLPPGVNPRSVAAISLSGTDDGMMDRQASSSSRPVVAALARVNQGAGPRRSLGATINAAATGGMAQHDREVREVVKLNVDSSNFEEWMKMATDNKINATNTWNFALIDYFHDMSLLRSDNGDGSINFQKASVTLDGCVKVWTSRVDSVVVETGKLLSGLQDDGKESNNKSGRGRGGGEGDEEDGIEEEDANGNIVKKSKKRTREPTLAKSFSQLAVKKLDLEFTVDPLFKKTSADFDEGGAGGLLMNHLGVDSNTRVVFDAGDVAGVGDDDQVETGLDTVEEDGDEDAANSAPADQVDLLELRSKLFSHLEHVNESDSLGNVLSGMVICPTFASFTFAPGDNTLFTALSLETAENTPLQFAPDMMPTLEEYDDELNDMGGFDDDGPDDAFGGVDPFGGGPITGAGYEYNDQELDEGMPGMEMRIPTNAPIDFTSAFQGITDEQGLKLNGDGLFDYFDQRLAKNWAGPEHWKMRNIGLGMPPLGQRGEGNEGGAVEKASRKSKEPFVVDFASEEASISSKVLFEPAKGGAGIMLPQQKDSSTLETYLLPEDQHFNSRQLLRLFIKPRAMLNLKRKGVAMASDTQQQHPADLDEEFWAKAAAAREASGGLGGGGSDYADGEGGSGGMPFDTQYFHDAEDDVGFDAMDEGPMDQVEDEELAAQALKRIRPEFVNYARKAKRVDVRKLKENIWKELAIEGEEKDVDSSSSSEEEEDQDMEGDSTPKATTAKRAASAARVSAGSSLSSSLQPKVFQSVLSGLRKTYAKDRMDEISTSFCFICLLHLANEEGLEIKTAESQSAAPGAGAGFLDRLAQMGAVVDDDDDDALGGEEDKGEARVGFLEQLSIVKDPNAGRSA